MRHHRKALALPIAILALGAVPAVATTAGTGVWITPPVVEHAATVGTIGTFTIGNGSGQTMKVTVVARPWLQSKTGAAVPNQRAADTIVRPSASAFTLNNGSRRAIALALLHAPPGGSLYASLDVTALPLHPSKLPNRLVLEYRLVGSLRLDPAHATYGARVGNVVVSGNHSRGTVSLAVTNTGNTIAATAGSATVSGARGGANGSVSSIRVLPGATVDVPVLGLDGSLPAGGYTLSTSLTLAGHHVANVHKSFTLH